jgi:hypothetical protein
MRREFLFSESDQAAPKGPAAFTSPVALDKRDGKRNLATIFGTRNMDDSVQPHIPAAMKLQVCICLADLVHFTHLTIAALAGNDHDAERRMLALDPETRVQGH